MEIVVHYFRLHINDYAQATSHLSLVEDAAYTRLLRKYYADERPLLADIDRLQRLVGARTREEKNAVKNVLQEFFFLDGEYYRNKRADLEIEEYKSKSLKAKESANARWMRSHSDSNANDVKTQSDSNANHKPITNNHKPIKERAARGTRLPDNLEMSDQWFDFCKQQRPDLNPREVFVAFRDYWIAQPGQKGSKSDWDATWRTWVRNQRKEIKPDWVVKKERADAAFNVMIGNQRSISGDVIDIEEDKNDPFRLSFGN